MGARQFIPCATAWFCLHLPIASQGVIAPDGVFFHCLLVLWLLPPPPQISSEQSLCPCTSSGLALQMLALKGQTYPLDPHALQLFPQLFLQDGAKLLQEVWVYLQGYQQPLLPTQGGLLPVWSKGGCWYQRINAWAVPWGGGWWGPPLWGHGSHQTQSKQLLALSRLHPSINGQLPPLIWLIPACSISYVATHSPAAAWDSLRSLHSQKATSELIPSAPSPPPIHHQLCPAPLHPHHTTPQAKHQLHPGVLRTGMVPTPVLTWWLPSSHHFGHLPDHCREERSLWESKRRGGPSVEASADHHLVFLYGKYGQTCPFGEPRLAQV